DDIGPSFGGATGLENRWTINGAPADDIKTGGVGTRLPLIFLDGIQVTAGGFSARDRTSTGGTIDAQLIGGSDHHEIQGYAWLSYNFNGRKKPIPDESYNIRTISVDLGPDVTLGLVARGPLGHVLGGTAWYAAGIAPNLSRTGFDWRAATLVDSNDDGAADGIPGQLATQTVELDHRDVLSYFIPMMGRVGLDRGVHHFDLSIVGDVSHSSRFIANSTIPASGVDRIDVVGDAIATWRAEWADTHLRVQLAWHRSYHDESARDPAAANKPQLLSLYVPTSLPDDPKLATACDDLGVDPFPLITNCPVPGAFFASGGAGLLTKQVGDRPSVTADVTRRLGPNTVRAGVTGEDTTLETTSRFTGNELDSSLFPQHLIQTRFIHDGNSCPDDPNIPCQYLDESVLDYRTLYGAAYIEDTWQAAPDIRVDGGLRWELMWVGTQVHFSDELSPRLGLAWDPLGGGRSRVWISMGRSYVVLPAGLGSTVTGRDSTVDDTTLPQGHGRDVALGNPITVLPGIKPMTQDELTAGGELAVERSVKLTGWVQGRRLTDGIDTTPTGVDNPGRDGSLDAERSS
ncbi:MAG TPA: TonB-dependent receptor, partial [Kofleriaceae bacterium]|nr:TonB-dependent receptor [Kofleriaceae bacterium]